MYINAYKIPIQVLLSLLSSLSTMASTRPNACVFTWATLFILFLLSYQVCAHGAHDHDADHEGGDDGDNNNNVRSKGLIIVKVWCLVILLVSTFAGGVSPYFYRWNESFLLLGTQFAGGIFLGTSLMHFLADSDEGFGNLTDKSYPFAFMLACVGYVLTMLGDCIVLFVTRNSEKSGVRVSVEAGGVGENEARRKEMELHYSHPGIARTTTFGDSVLLILALCFHSVFEGIAIGVAGILTSLDSLIYPAQEL